MFRSLLFVAGIAAAVVRADDRPKIVPGRYIVQLKPGTDSAVVEAHHEAVRRIAKRDHQLLARSIDNNPPTCGKVVTVTVTENAPGPASPTSIPGSDLKQCIERTFTLGHGNFNAYVGNFDEAAIKEIEKLPNVISVQPDEYVYLDQPKGGAQYSASALAGYSKSSPSYSTGSISTPSSKPYPTGTYPIGKYPTGNDTHSLQPSAGSTAVSSTLLPKPSSTGTTPPINSSSLTIQENSIWSLADLSHKNGINDTTTYSYIYDSSAGAGQTAYVFDTGIRSTHTEFQGRVRFGVNALTNSTTGNADGNNDSTGHGTHVAGTLIGATYGVAKHAHVVDVKVFDTGSATLSSILAGIDWAVKDAAARNALSTSVFSMSFGARTSSDLLDAAVKAVYTDYGILTVAAAGNENADIGNTTPARVAEAFTVGYTDRARRRVDSASGVQGSNFGAALDVWAPGFEIVSADYMSDAGTRVESGTSMAAPVVAGLVCYLRGLEDGLASPAAVTARILELGEEGVVGDARGSKNVFVYNGSGK